MSYDLNGGNTFLFELRNLAVPFGIVLTKYALEYMVKKSPNIRGRSKLGKVSKPKRSSPGKKTSSVKRGGCGSDCSKPKACTTCGSFAGGNSMMRSKMDAEIGKIARELREALSLN